MPLRALYRRAVERAEVAVNPVDGVRLPPVTGRRERIASPAEAATLLGALPDEIRGVWAVAMYAGLRLGELQALRDEDVDLEAGEIRVEQSWDKVAGPVKPKSRAWRRRVPIVAALRPHLAAHRLRRGGTSGLFFGDQAGAFNDDTARARANKAWKKAKLEALGFHECRHTFASICIAAGANPKTLSEYLGHSSITITMDRYGHLMPGSKDEFRNLVDEFLERSTGAASAADSRQASVQAN
jgi:integrase